MTPLKSSHDTTVRCVAITKGAAHIKWGCMWCLGVKNKTSVLLGSSQLFNKHGFCASLRWESCCLDIKNWRLFILMLLNVDISSKQHGGAR